MGNARALLFFWAWGLSTAVTPALYAQSDALPARPPATPPAPSAAPATEGAPGAEDFDAWIALQRDARGRSCERLAVEVVDTRYVVACGGAGVWIVKRESG